MNFYFTQSSRNQKTGPIPVVTASKDTCPTDCPLKQRGCYAESGPIGLFWRRLSDGDLPGLTFAELLKRIRSLPSWQLWRYGQAGDLPESRDDVLALARANRGRPAIAYTHRRDIETYREAAQLGFHINLSANCLEEADTLAETGLPIVTVLASEYGRRREESVGAYRDRLGGRLSIRTPSGRKVAICPATYREGTTCATCGLCAKPRNGGVIIGFPAHGAAKKQIDRLLSNTRTNQPCPPKTMISTSLSRT